MGTQLELRGPATLRVDRYREGRGSKRIGSLLSGKLQQDETLNHPCYNNDNENDTASKPTFHNARP